MKKARRREYRTGSISCNRGRFVARVPLADGTRFYLGTYATKKDAERALLRLREKLKKGQTVTHADGKCAFCGLLPISDKELQAEKRRQERQKQRQQKRRKR